MNKCVKKYKKKLDAHKYKDERLNEFLRKVLLRGLNFRRYKTAQNSPQF